MPSVSTDLFSPYAFKKYALLNSTPSRFVEMYIAFIATNAGAKETGLFPNPVKSPTSIRTNI